MELHSQMAAKKLWNYLRIAFFMVRNGLISKRKFIMDMSLMIKRGKFIGKTLAANLVFHHHHHHHQSATSPPLGHAGFGVWEYEFSCSNSPNPKFFKRGGRHHYFPCIHASPTADDDSIEDAVRTPVGMLRMIDYSLSPQYVGDIAEGERCTPLRSPFVEASGGGLNVDSEAEEFIKKFYEKLRVQSGIALLQNQELQ